MNTLELATPPSRAADLKAATAAAHRALEDSVMASEPFASRESFGRFVLVQRAFHREIDALYSAPALDALLPDLAGRRRLGQLDLDLADFGLQPLAAPEEPAFQAGAVDVPTALGWLYVAEGSNLGAAVLLKQAKALGLSEAFGARHLAPASGGRGLHWRTFTSALDAIDLSAAEQSRVVSGALDGFERFKSLVRSTLRA